MNKKAALIHWILFGIIAAFGLFFFIMADLDSGFKAKGMWQLSFIRAAQDAEKDLLLLDQEAVVIAKKVVENIAEEVSQTDLGCGMHQNISLWNIKDSFCEVKLSDKVVKNFNTLAENEMGLKYDQLLVSEQYLIGKSNKNKVIRGSLNVIPTETQSTVFFTSYEGFLIKPFYLHYEYSPNFRVNIASSLEEYNAILKESRLLTEKCRDTLYLFQCLDSAKGSSWSYSSCEHENYNEEDRKVAFCVKAKEGNRYTLALDFTPLLPFSMEDILVSLLDNKYEISFTLVENNVYTYFLHYTTWLQAVNNLPGKAAEIFASMPSSFGYVYQKIPLTVPATENCLTEKNQGEVYLCDNKIIYSIKDDTLTGNVLFGVTTMKEGKESLLTKMVKAKETIVSTS